MFIVVLGGGIDLNGNLPPHVYQRLDKALKLYKKLPRSKIVLSGKYSFLYSLKKPPITEAEKMAQYLIEKGVPKKDIFLEKKSQDTISNAYYLKTDFLLPLKEKRAIVVTSDFHQQRVRYIFKKVFGEGYQFQFIATPSGLPEKAKEKIFRRQKELIFKTKELFAKMKDGDHQFLKGKFYKARFYQEKRPAWVKDFAAKGKL